MKKYGTHNYSKKEKMKGKVGNFRYLNGLFLQNLRGSYIVISFHWIVLNDATTHGPFVQIYSTV